MATTVDAYRIRFERTNVIAKGEFKKNQDPNVESFLNVARKQEILNLIEKLTKVWTVDFKKEVTRIYADDEDYTIEINPILFDELNEEEKVYILLKEIEKIRMGLVKPSTYLELTVEQSTKINDVATSIVGFEVAASAINKLNLLTSK